MAMEEWVPRLEGIIEEIRSRLDTMDRHMNSIQSRMDARFNTLATVTGAMWVTTMVAVLSTLADVLFKGKHIKQAEKLSGR